MIKDTLISLLTPYGPTGQEGDVAETLRQMLAGRVDDLRTDVMGNLIATLHGQGKRILFSAHMDHIGLVVIDADKHGYLRVAPVGGIRPQWMVCQPVAFPGGLSGVVSAQDDAEGPLGVQHLFIDIGAEDRDEALAMAPIGTVGVYAPRIQELGPHRIAAPAMDDRAGCALVAQMLLEIENCPNELVCVFSTQEEVGLRGATVAGYAEHPDIAIALDVTPSTDTPGGRPKMAMKLGGGPAVKVMDRSLIATPSVRDAMVRAAQQAGVPHQMEIITMGGTDGGAIQTSRGGVPTGVLSVPCRYVHSAVETVDLRDMAAGVELLKAFVSQTF